jgi:hypothetical protein
MGTKDAKDEPSARCESPISARGSLAAVETSTVKAIAIRPGNRLEFDTIATGVLKGLIIG